MELNVSIKDKIKLNYDIREFDINKYYDGNQLYSFNSVQLNIIPSSNDVKLVIHDFLPCNAPILLSNYEEEILKITLENNRKIGYTKSFRIDLLKAIEENEITINDLSNNEQKQKDNLIFGNFISDLREANENFAIGLITKSERKNSLISSFQYFYRTMFKDELEQRKRENTKLTDEEFFSIKWNGRMRPDKINNITFIWPHPTSSNWVSQFYLEGIKRGIDKKTSIKFTFSGIYISKEKYGDSNKCQATLTIQISQKNYRPLSTNMDDLIFDAELWERNKEFKKLETKNLWQNKEFMKMLERVIESPTY